MVLLEMRLDEVWQQVGPPVTQAGDPGSVTREEPSGRQVYLFGFQDGRPGVWISSFGGDAATRQQRTIVSSGLEQLSDLTQPFELPPARSTLAIRSDMAAPTYAAPSLRVRLVAE